MVGGFVGSNVAEGVRDGIRVCVRVEIGVLVAMLCVAIGVRVDNRAVAVDDGVKVVAFAHPMKLNNTLKSTICFMQTL